MDGTFDAVQAVLGGFSSGIVQLHGLRVTTFTRDAPHNPQKIAHAGRVLHKANKNS